ncbi:MAG TPA: Gfo/Idh/MocA family oxidoreductase, partial [Bacteroidetes bacterium]|nr:Gfo/Idh/MocA family oxidoreductase [Bacteroidota bacterium]
MQPIRFAVIGLGGYAQVHVQAVRWLARTGQARLSAVVVRERERGQHAEAIHRLRRQGVRFFSSYADLLAESTACADVLTVPTGIHQHAEISIAALQAGLHVYCEKPAAATVSEVDRMISAADRTGRLCTIGYQYLYNTTIRDLKKMICSGRTGAVRSIRLLCGWPRSEAYYQRNEWAGRLRLNDTLVLDTPANNAMAHFLFNALWLARDDAHSSARPHRVEAELFRANDIESADTVLLRVLTHEG